MGMKKYITLGVLLMTFLSGCKYDLTDMTGKTTQKTEPTIETIIGHPQTLENQISIGTFNIQVFGKTKRSKEDVMSKLVEIVEDYNIIAIQEFRDVSMETVPYFLEKINSHGNNYSVVASERLGRTNSKERYAFYYDNEMIEYLNRSFTYPDNEDVFEREPFIAYFKAKKGNFDFYLVNIHTKPEDAENEIKNLDKVVKYVLQEDPQEKDVIILGDFNADGSYYDEDKKNLGEQYFWAITDKMDTTVADSDNTYDRIVFIKKDTETDYAYKSGIDRFSKRWTGIEFKEISDHYPAWIICYDNKDKD